MYVLMSQCASLLCYFRCDVICQYFFVFFIVILFVPIAPVMNDGISTSTMSLLCEAILYALRDLFFFCGFGMSVFVICHALCECYRDSDAADAAAAASVVMVN